MTSTAENTGGESVNSWKTTTGAAGLACAGRSLSGSAPLPPRRGLRLRPGCRNFASEG